MSDSDNMFEVIDPAGGSELQKNDPAGSHDDHEAGNYEADDVSDADDDRDNL